jgi:hypothetical protein
MSRTLYIFSCCMKTQEERHYFSQTIIVVSKYKDRDSDPGWKFGPTILLLINQRNSAPSRQNTSCI